MSVILEFTIGNTEFELGRALCSHGETFVELERIVPVAESLIPFFWVEGGESAQLEASVAESSYIENLSTIDSIGTRTLYRVDWTGEPGHLLEGMKRNEATILEARSQNRWRFRLRFRGHGQISRFHTYCGEHEIPVEVELVHPLTEDGLRDRIAGLTPEQRETVLLALEAGYFTIPREASMAELAAELDISQQAASERLRRGTKRVLENVTLK